MKIDLTKFYVDTLSIYGKEPIIKKTAAETRDFYNEILRARRAAKTKDFRNTKRTK